MKGNMEIHKKTPPTEAEISEAIQIRTSECFGALNIANALGGSETNSWYLIRNYTLEQLKEEATTMGLAFRGGYDVLKGEVWQ